MFVTNVYGSFYQVGEQCVTRVCTMINTTVFESVTLCNNHFSAFDCTCRNVSLQRNIDTVSVLHQHKFHFDTVSILRCSDKFCIIFSQRCISFTPNLVNYLYTQR